MTEHLRPCPCGQGCTLSYQSPDGGSWRIVAYPCGTEGPARGDIIITEEEAARAWNAWIIGLRGRPNHD